MYLVLKTLEEHQKDMKKLTFETDRMILCFLKNPAQHSNYSDD